MSFGETVRRLRMERRWTLAELGQRTGAHLSAGAVGSVEKGRSNNPTEETVRRFARAFDLTPHALRQLAGLDPVHDPAHVPTLAELRTAAADTPDLLVLLQDMERDQHLMSADGWRRLAQVFYGEIARERERLRQVRQRPERPAPDAPDEATVQAQSRIYQARADGPYAVPSGAQTVQERRVEYST